MAVAVSNNNKKVIMFLERVLSDGDERGRYDEKRYDEKHH